MALIKCPECEKEVSSSAVNCIHCGYPIAKYMLQQKLESKLKRRSSKPVQFNKKGILILVCIIAALTIVSLFLQKNRSDAFSDQEKAACEMLINNFKYSSNIEVISGYIDDDCEYAYLTISHIDVLGKYVTDHYSLTKYSCVEISDMTDEKITTIARNIELSKLIYDEIDYTRISEYVNGKIT